MSWVSIGTRKQSVLDKSFKLISWSKNLKKELGWGYTEFITTKAGDQFVKSEDEDKILKLADKLDNFDKYMQLMDEADEQIFKILENKRKDYLKIFDLQLNQLAYFLIARMIADNIYKKSSTDIKKQIEGWRNRKNLFSSQFKVFKSVVSFLDVSNKVLDHMTLDEAKKHLRGKKINQEEIEKRFNKYWSLSLRNNKIKLYLEDLDPIKDQIETKAIKGRSAFAINKKIIGIVGKDILVVPMTHPGMLPKIRKMKAVITDEGGVLCHAAITAREFKIPTIIGTKIATQVLKRGDRVEVNTNNGVIKILNK